MVMTQNTFIEKAIAGGWRKDANPILMEDGTLCLFTCTQRLSFADVLMDPEAWRAVGKVEGWGLSICDNDVCNDMHPMYIVNMHRMIDALVLGVTKTEYLKTL